MHAMRRENTSFLLFLPVDGLIPSIVALVTAGICVVVIENKDHQKVCARTATGTAATSNEFFPRLTMSTISISVQVAPIFAETGDFMQFGSELIGMDWNRELERRFPKSENRFSHRCK
jgi:hypothetical protein